MAIIISGLLYVPVGVTFDMIAKPRGMKWLNGSTITEFLRLFWTIELPMSPHLYSIIGIYLEEIVILTHKMINDRL